MRKSLMQRLTVGVVGEGKAGKSTLVSGLLNLPTGASGCIRTQDIALYRMGNLDVLDFPHTDSANDEVVKKAFATHSSMLDAVVVLVAAAGANDRDGVQTALQGVTEAAM
jgi:ABC-type cobalamin/Fe3+-siderophores transport system ATPase subunit